MRARLPERMEQDAFLQVLEAVDKATYFTCQYSQRCTLSGFASQVIGAVCQYSMAVSYP